jgi:hypothetical protein
MEHSRSLGDHQKTKPVYHEHKRRRGTS